MVTNKELLEKISVLVKQKQKDLKGTISFKDIDLEESFFSTSYLLFDYFSITLTEINQIVFVISLLCFIFPVVNLKTSGQGRAVYSSIITESNPKSSWIFIKHKTRTLYEISSFGPDSNKFINICLNQEFQERLKEKNIPLKVSRVDIRYFGPEPKISKLFLSYGLAFSEIAEKWKQRKQGDDAYLVGYASKVGVSLYIERHSKEDFLKIYTKKGWRELIEQQIVNYVAVELVFKGKPSIEQFQKNLEKTNRNLFVGEALQRYLHYTSLLPDIEPLLEFHKFRREMDQERMKTWEESFPIFQPALMIDDIELERKYQIKRPTTENPALFPFLLMIAGYCFLQEKEKPYTKTIRLVKKDLIKILGLKEDHERSYQKIHDIILELHGYLFIEKRGLHTSVEPIFLKTEFVWGKRSKYVDVTPNINVFASVFSESSVFSPALLKNMKEAYFLRFGAVRKRYPNYLFKIVILLILSQNEDIIYHRPRNAKNFLDHVQWLLVDFLPSQGIFINPVINKNKYLFLEGSLILR